MPASLQNAYSIIDRRDDDLLAFAREREIASCRSVP
jgi:hypothetical protein